MQVPLSMTREKVKLMQQSWPQHLHKGTAITKEEKEMWEEGNDRRVNTRKKLG